MQDNMMKIIAVGDIFLADSPLKTGLGVRKSIKSNGKAHFIEKMKAILNGYDICFGNIECVLSDKNYNKYSISSVEIRGESDFAEIISESGFNVVNIANNHIFQHGLDPYIDTIHNLENKGVKVIGDEYFNKNLETFEQGDIKVGFVGYSMHYEQYYPNEKVPYALKEKPEYILADIRRIKANFDGLLVCSLHWGYEYLDTISLEQQELCHQLVDCGVGLVLGHHSHVPQGIEKYNGALIAYSLGNFVFDMDIDITRKSYALEINISRNGPINSRIIPIRIGDDCCPCLMDKSGSECFIAKINDLSSDIVKKVSLTDNQMKAIERDASRIIYNHNYKIFFSNIFKTNIYYSLNMIFRALMRRIGILHNP